MPESECNSATGDSFLSQPASTPQSRNPLYPILPIVKWRIHGFISFLTLFVLREMQKISPRIWIRVTVSIFYDDNYYIENTFFLFDRKQIIDAFILWRENIYSGKGVFLWNLFISNIKWFIQLIFSVGWGCRVHQQHLCKGLRPPQRVSYMWHQTILWWVYSDAEALGNAVYPFNAIAPRSNQARSGSTLQGSIFRSNRTKLRTSAKQNYLK